VHITNVSAISITSINDSLVQWSGEVRPSFTNNTTANVGD